MGKAIPYGVYDLGADEGTMSHFLLKFSGGHSVFRLQPDRTLRV
jgi:hypothetical protein